MWRSSVLFACVCLAALGCADSAGAAAPKRTVVYAQAIAEQFVNNRDDRARGLGNNPFGNSGGTGVAGASAHGNGPQPGDEGIFEFALSARADLRGRIGTGVIVCQYGFAKTGMCEGSYSLRSSKLVALGSLAALTTKPFTLVVTGSSGAERGSRGTVVVSADTSPDAPGNTHITHTVPSLLLVPQRLVFSLRPASSPARTKSMYSHATQEQFIDNDDDEVLGYSRNPYGMRDPQIESARSGDGPFPGDESIFSFAVAGSAKGKPTATGTYTCEYTFDRNAYCNASYRFADGVVFADGTFDFDAKTYALAVIAGNGAYRGATGEIDSGPGPSGTQRLRIAIASGPPVTGRFTAYSVATAEQFVNNADDRLRGKGNNPFGNFHDTSPTTKQEVGPFPGDQALFTFDVYRTPAHRAAVGTAAFSCLYTFGKHAFCQVSYHLPAGTIEGVGAFDFSASSFTLAVTGGTKAYYGRTGTMRVDSVSSALQRLTVELH